MPASRPFSPDNTVRGQRLSGCELKRFGSYAIFADSPCHGQAMCCGLWRQGSGEGLVLDEPGHDILEGQVRARNNRDVRYLLCCVSDHAQTAFTVLVQNCCCVRILNHFKVCRVIITIETNLIWDASFRGISLRDSCRRRAENHGDSKRHYCFRYFHHGLNVTHL